MSESFSFQTPQSALGSTSIDVPSVYKQVPQVASFSQSTIGNQAPTVTPANNAATQAIGSGIQAGSTLLAGGLQASAMDTAGATAQAQSMGALDQIEKDARIDRALQTKAQRLRKEQDAYRQMNENIGMRIQVFQRTLADKLDKANQLNQYSERLQGMQTRDQQISDVQLQQMGDM